MSETTTKIIEHVYFHWGNGGLTLKVVEHVYTTGPYNWQEVPEVKTHTYYRMEVNASHHGAEMKTHFDLGSMEVVGWLHEMTGRLLKRMVGKHEQARHHAFDYEKSGEIRVEEGEEKTYHFRVDVDGTILPTKLRFQDADGKEKS